MESDERYRYEDQDGPHEYTRREILASYFPYWSAEMQRIGKAAQISEQACVDDWIVVNWAYRV